MACEHGHDHDDGTLCPSCFLVPIFLSVFYSIYYFLQPILGPFFVLNVWNPIKGIKAKVDNLASENAKCCGKSESDEATQDEVLADDGKEKTEWLAAVDRRNHGKHFNELIMINRIIILILANKWFHNYAKFLD